MSKIDWSWEMLPPLVKIPANTNFLSMLIQIFLQKCSGFHWKTKNVSGGGERNFVFLFCFFPKETLPCQISLKTYFLWKFSFHQKKKNNPIFCYKKNVDGKFSANYSSDVAGVFHFVFCLSFTSWFSCTNSALQCLNPNRTKPHPVFTDSLKKKTKKTLLFMWNYFFY